VCVWGCKFSQEVGKGLVEDKAFKSRCGEEEGRTHRQEEP
jgi:hypothetical protein